MKYSRKSRKRIEDSSEIGEWREEKCRDDIYLIEVFRVESIDKTKKWEEKCDEKEDEESNERMLEHTWMKIEWYPIDDERDESATYDSTKSISCDDGRWMDWCDEELFDGFLELRSEKWWRHICIGIRDHRHKDDTRNQECDIVTSSDLPYTTSDESSEDDEVERLCDDWWKDGLWPDTYDTDEFFSDDSIEGGELHNIFLKVKFII